jgi:hypothetical protein
VLTTPRAAGDTPSRCVVAPLANEPGVLYSAEGGAVLIAFGLRVAAASRE